MEQQPTQSTANRVFGTAAMWLSIIMWLSLVDQIRINLSGQKSSLLVGVAIITNCIFWVMYGYTHKPRLLKVSWANVPGVVLGVVNLITILR